MNFKNIKIAVIGDIMLDRYIFGKVERISPEAPIPVVTVTKESEALGGAANVAANISAMGGQATMFGIVGEDEAKDKLLKRFDLRNISSKGLITDNTKKTIQKIRILGEHQQMVRVDYEDTTYINNKVEEELFSTFCNSGKFDALIISDYAKGTITETLYDKLNKKCKELGTKVIVDPKPSLHKFYNNCTLITPNKKEAQEMSGLKINSVEDVPEAGKQIVQKFKTNLVITLGDLGMMVFDKDKKPEYIKTEAKEVFDVSGAGDTVISALTLALCSGVNLLNASNFANIAAGIKVSKLGTAPVKIEEIVAKLNDRSE